jgi:hypothetical protein
MNQLDLQTWDDFETLKRKCDHLELVVGQLCEIVLDREGFYGTLSQGLPYGAIFGEMPPGTQQT